MAATFQRLQSEGEIVVGPSWSGVGRVWLALLLVIAVTGPVKAQNGAVPFILLDGQRVHPSSVLVKYGTRTTAATE